MIQTKVDEDLTSEERLKKITSHMEEHLGKKGAWNEIEEDIAALQKKDETIRTHVKKLRHRVEDVMVSIESVSVATSEINQQTRSFANETLQKLDMLKSEMSDGDARLLNKVVIMLQNETS